jgi:hypothetical protein
MSEHAEYRQLARFNRRIVEGRERVAVQKARVSERRNRPGRNDAEALLRVLERSLRLKIQYRDMLIKELMRWPNYR